MSKLRLEKGEMRTTLNRSIGNAPSADEWYERTTDTSRSFGVLIAKREVMQVKELIRLDDALTKYEWSRDLREYVVPVSVLKRLPRIDEPEEPAEDQSNMLRILFNRCYALAGGMCFFCGMRDDCDKYRSVGKDGGA